MAQATPPQRKAYFEARNGGWSIRKAARIAGVSESTGGRWDQEWRTTDAAVRSKIERAEKKTGGPVPYEALCKEAKAAFDDFSIFEERYFGMIPHPWQAEVANGIRDLYESPEKEYADVNCPPGAGKTSLVTLRIPAWLICRDRSIRMMIGSATKGLAKNNVRALRRELARVHPLKNPEDEVRKGLAYDAIATMSEDFGRFKPVESDIWTSEAFTVEQMTSHGPLSEKEPTVSAYGIDSEYTGLRYPLAIWDDLVSLMNQSTPEMRAKIERIWMSVCENRIEPGGLIVLMGQRLMADDLYNFVKQMVVPVDEEAIESEDDEAYEGPVREKYRRFIYKAHYEDKCAPGTHKRGAPAWPDGCLLVPERLTYRDIRIAEAKDDFQTVYQQEDVNPDEVLVRREWIFGEGEWTGCLDRDRDMWEIPDRIDGSQLLSVVSADPSPSNYWAVQWWLYDPETEYRYLMAFHRKKMSGPDFLDFNMAEGAFTGLLHEWHEMTTALGHPFTHLIFEENAGNKWLTQFDLFRKWKDRHDVELILHTTGRNKADPDYGVWSIAPHYKFGRVRLPFREGTVGRARTSDLVKELTTYTRISSGKTDDGVMAHWFFENRLPDLTVTRRALHRQPRPSWLRTQRQAAGRRPAWLTHA